MNILVTGGCGFIGTRLVRSWKGHRVRVVDNGLVGDVEEAGDSWSDDRVQVIRGDVCDEGTMLRATEGAEVVVHLAANTGVEPSVRDPRADFTTNALGTLNCLEAARRHGVRRFVFSSSGAALGDCAPPFHEKLAPRVASPYGAGKLSGEAYCSAYHRSFGVPTVALRFSNVYGPGSDRKDSLVARFTRQALAGETILIHGDGEQTRDFLYIDDLARGVDRAIFAEGVAGEVFQVASNVETSVNEVLALLTKAWKAHGIGDPTVERGAPRKGDVRRNHADASKARCRLEWRTEVPLEEGIMRTVEWFVRNTANARR